MMYLLITQELKPDHFLLSESTAEINDEPLLLQSIGASTQEWLGGTHRNARDELLNLYHRSHCSVIEIQSGYVL